jgi:hypothetical protein
VRAEWRGQLTRGSKPEDRAEGDAEVVVCTLIEVDLVTEFEAQSQRAEGRLDTGRGIKCEIEVGSAQAGQRACERRERKQTGAEAKIHKAELGSYEGMKSALARRRKFEAKKTVGDTDGGALNCRNVAGGYIMECFIEVDTVVVGEFPFQHDSGMSAVGEACAEAEVAGAGLGDAEVIEKDAGFDALLSERGGAGCTQRSGNCDEDEGARDRDHGITCSTAFIAWKYAGPFRERYGLPRHPAVL